jgi:hypothetical protein
MRVLAFLMFLFPVRCHNSGSSKLVAGAQFRARQLRALPFDR